MAEYVLGHSDHELRRLESQARVIDPMTRRFFVEAGVEPGMRVLDVGSGGGEVALLVADLVGEHGSVVGFDLSAAGIELARSKVAARSLDNVSFVVGAGDEVSFDEPFDAVVGRYVLQFQPDPGRLLARVASFARPGGLVVFHELDWAAITSDPPVPTYEQVRVWLQAAIEGSGASAHCGMSLPRVFADAGLPEPTMRMESLIGAGATARDPIERIGHLAPTLLPALVRHGIVDPETLDVDTLVDRMVAEAVSTRSVVRSHLEIAAWARA